MTLTEKILQGVLMVRTNQGPFVYDLSQAERAQIVAALSPTTAGVPMQETCASIAQWSEQTFGPVASNYVIATRANEEMAELLRALSNGDGLAAVEEAADVLIVLCRLAMRIEEDLGSFSPGDVRRKLDAPLISIASCANVYLARLMFQLADDDEHPMTYEHMLRVFNALYDLLAQMQVSPAKAIADKMAINRARTWTKDGDGCGRHVKISVVGDNVDLGSMIVHAFAPSDVGAA